MVAVPDPYLVLPPAKGVFPTSLRPLAANPARAPLAVICGFCRIICWIWPARWLNGSEVAAGWPRVKNCCWPPPRTPLGSAPASTALLLGERLARVGATGNPPATICPSRSPETPGCWIAPLRLPCPKRFESTRLKARDTFESPRWSACKFENAPGRFESGPLALPIPVIFRMVLTLRISLILFIFSAL